MIPSWLVKTFYVVGAWSPWQWSFAGGPCISLTVNSSWVEPVLNWSCHCSCPMSLETKPQLMICWKKLILRYMHLCVTVCVHMWVCVYVCVCVCMVCVHGVCTCEREREREREKDWLFDVLELGLGNIVIWSNTMATFYAIAALLLYKQDVELLALLDCATYWWPDCPWQLCL